jgi:hypothetical protein
MSYLNARTQQLYQRNYKNLLVAQGKCQQCREHNPAPHLNARVCPSCNERQKAAKRAWNKKQAARLRELRALLKSRRVR